MFIQREVFEQNLVSSEYVEIIFGEQTTIAKTSLHNGQQLINLLQSKHFNFIHTIFL